MQEQFLEHFWEQGGKKQDTATLIGMCFPWYCTNQSTGSCAMGRNNTSRKICWAVGKDEVPGPNPGSSSKIASFRTETGDFCYILNIALEPICVQELLACQHVLHSFFCRICVFCSRCSANCGESFNNRTNSLVASDSGSSIGAGFTYPAKNSVSTFFASRLRSSSMM